MTTETPKTWAPDTEPTPAQALAWFRACTDEEGEKALDSLMTDASRGYRCFLQMHDTDLRHYRDRIEQL